MRQPRKGRAAGRFGWRWCGGMKVRESLILQLNLQKLCSEGPSSSVLSVLRRTSGVLHMNGAKMKSKIGTLPRFYNFLYDLRAP